MVQLACDPLPAIIKARFAENGGVKTTPSIEREEFEWVRSRHEEEESQSQLEWLTKWDASICEEIALAGGGDVLKPVREQGCEGDARTCMCAAGGDHLEISVLGKG